MLVAKAFRMALCFVVFGPPDPHALAQAILHQFPDWVVNNNKTISAILHAAIEMTLCISGTLTAGLTGASFVTCIKGFFKTSWKVLSSILDFSADGFMAAYHGRFLFAGGIPCDGMFQKQSCPCGLPT